MLWGRPVLEQLQTTACCPRNPSIIVKAQPNATIRTFVAVKLPPEVDGAISAYVSPLRHLPGSVSWVKAENVHLTLKFLGDTAQEKIERIAAVLRDLTRAASPISATVGGSGVFPNEHRPRVLWIGLEENSGALGKLAAAIDDGLYPLGLPKENRPFRAHLTIGRVREGSVEKIVAAMRAQPFDRRAVQVQEITLMRSELHPGGSIYTPLCRIMLGGP